MDPNGQLMDIGTVAAANIVRALDLAPTEANVVAAKKAIRDEVSAMSTHFTLAFADISTAHEVAETTMRERFAEHCNGMAKQYEKDIAEFRSTFKYARENWTLISAVLAVSFLLGSLAEYLI